MVYLGLMLLAAVLEIVTTPGASYASISPVPEPATLVLLGAGAGAAGVAAWVKRRRRK